MKLADYTQASNHVVSAEDELRMQVRNELYHHVSAERLAGLLALGRARARVELAALVEQVLNAKAGQSLVASFRQRVIDDVVDMVLGLGPIEPLLVDEEITEVMVVGPDKVFFEKGGVVQAAREVFESEDQLRQVVDRIVSPLGRRVDEQSPIVNARLAEGHRVNAVIPPVSLCGTLLTIRKFRTRILSLEEMVELDSMSPEIAQLLRWAVRSRKNIAVSGGTGGGKTTLLNALSQQIPHEERIITIEDSAELRFDEHPHVVRMEARSSNAEGFGEVTIRDLVTNSLRMRPDRIIVGECRGAEALDMLQAMNTGHDGSLTTLHANSPAEVVTRLVMMVRFGMDLPTQVVEAQVLSALDLIVQQDRLGSGHRRITQIAVRFDDATACECEGLYAPLVQWDRRGRKYSWKAEPCWLESLILDGVATEEEVETWRLAVQSCL